jgi:hypothetical protein
VRPVRRRPAALAAAGLLVLAAPAMAASVPPALTARQALLGRAELGRGWSVEAKPPARVPGLRCHAFSPLLSGVRERAAVASPTFKASSTGPFLSQSAYLYGDAAQERAVWRHVVVSGLLRCTAARFAAAGRAYAVTSSHVSALRGAGSAITRYRIGGTVTGGGQTLPAFLDELVLGRASLITVLDVASLDAPASDSLERRVAALAAQRLRRTT